MTSFVLKWIALLTMITDHIGAVFFPHEIWIRCIGRLSFPIFAFLLAEGFTHTKNRSRYAIRLLVFGLISEVPHDLLFHGTLFYPGKQNIMFELLFGLLTLSCIEKSGLFSPAQRNKYLYIVPAAALILMSEYLDLSYGIYGIFLMISFYIFRSDIKKSAFASAVVTLLFNGITVLSFSLPGKVISLTTINTTQLYAGLSAVPICLYNGQKGKYSMKWFFYAAYPLHMLILRIFFIALNF